MQLCKSGHVPLASYDRRGWDTLRVKPRAFRMRSGCDIPTPCARCWLVKISSMRKSFTPTETLHFPIPRPLRTFFQHTPCRNPRPQAKPQTIRKGRVPRIRVTNHLARRIRTRRRGEDNCKDDEMKKKSRIELDYRKTTIAYPRSSISPNAHAILNNIYSIT